MAPTNSRLNRKNMVAFEVIERIQKLLRVSDGHARAVSSVPRVEVTDNKAGANVDASVSRKRIPAREKWALQVHIDTDAVWCGRGCHREFFPRHGEV